MALFKNKDDREKVRVFLEGKDWVKFDEITLGVDLSRTQTKKVLYQLKYKKLVENLDDSWKLLPIVEKEKEVTVEVKVSNQDVIEPPPKPEEIPEEKPLEYAEPNPELQHKGLNARVDDLNKKLDMALGVKEHKEKKARLKKLGIAKLRRFNRKKNQAVLLLGRDHSIRLVKAEKILGMVKVADNYHDGSARYTWLWLGKYPVYIIPEWDIEPINAEDLQSKTVNNKSHIESQTISIRAIEMTDQDKEAGDKKKQNWMLWVGIAIVGIIVAWVFLGGNKQ